MPFPISDLLADRPAPVVVELDRTVDLALDLMLTHDYSQLPVVGDNERLHGIITIDSIFKATQMLGVSPADLRVGAAKVPATTFRAEDDLFDVIEGLMAAYAAVIVDGEQKVTGIITNFDAADYFRRRVEDVMLIEDVERMIRAFILLAFPDASAGKGDSDLDRAVSEAVAPKLPKAPFKRALSTYLKARGETKPVISTKAADEAYAALVCDIQKPKKFEDLAFSEYTTMLLQADRWARYQSVLHVDRDAVSKMLDYVREIRNKLSHFRGDVSATEHEHLVTCRNLLLNYQDAAVELFVGRSTKVREMEAVDEGAMTRAKQRAVEALTEVGGRNRVFAALWEYLHSVPGDPDVVVLNFESIERLLDRSLPHLAREHPSWWSMDASGRPCSTALSHDDWRVFLNPSRGVVRFQRVRRSATRSEQPARSTNKTDDG
jgi:CBS domain-containing protein